MPFVLGYVGAVLALVAAVLGFFVATGEVPRPRRRRSALAAAAVAVVGLALVGSGVVVDHVQHDRALVANLWAKYEVRPVGAAQLGAPVTLRTGDGQTLHCALSGSFDDPVATCGGTELGSPGY